MRTYVFHHILIFKCNDIIKDDKRRSSYCKRVKIFVPNIRFCLTSNRKNLNKDKGCLPFSISVEQLKGIGSLCWAEPQKLVPLASSFPLHALRESYPVCFSEREYSADSSQILTAHPFRNIKMQKYAKGGDYTFPIFLHRQ